MQLWSMGEKHLTLAGSVQIIFPYIQFTLRTCIQNAGETSMHNVDG